MKKLLVGFSMFALVLAAGFGCGKKEGGQPADKVPIEVKKAETMDTTRMDSAAMDTTATDSTVTDTAAKAPDSL